MSYRVFLHFLIFGRGLKFRLNIRQRTSFLLVCSLNTFFLSLELLSLFSSFLVISLSLSISISHTNFLSLSHSLSLSLSISLSIYIHILIYLSSIYGSGFFFCFHFMSVCRSQYI